jgi:hypothetical protein
MAVHTLRERRLQKVAKKRLGTLNEDEVLHVGNYVGPLRGFSRQHLKHLVPHIKIIQALLGVGVVHENFDRRIVQE